LACAFGIYHFGLFFFFVSSRPCWSRDMPFVFLPCAESRFFHLIIFQKVLCGWTDFGEGSPWLLFAPFPVAVLCHFFPPFIAGRGPFFSPFCFRGRLASMASRLGDRLVNPHLRTSGLDPPSFCFFFDRGFFWFVWSGTTSHSWLVWRRHEGLILPICPGVFLPFGPAPLILLVGRPHPPNLGSTQCFLNLPPGIRFFPPRFFLSPNPNEGSGACS